MLTRRQLIGGILGSSTLAVSTSPGADPLSLLAPSLASPTVPAFRKPLVIPDVLAPVSSDDNADYYEITMQEAQVEIIPEMMTTVWTYNGVYPGPTIKARSGRPIIVRQNNALPESMSIHLHGGHTPPGSDGHPYDLIAPGSSKDYEYPNNQIPATLWYHDHAVDGTGRHVYMGLAAFYMMTDEFEESLPLPSGENDIPLLIQDRLFNADGSLNYPLNDQTVLAGILGDRLLVNGVIQPYLEVARRKVRFRIVNGSNTRSYSLGLSTGQPLIQIGSDGGLLSQPVSRRTINIAPAERIDVVVDFSSYPLGTNITLKNAFVTTDRNLNDVMQFRVLREERDDSFIPAQLRYVEPIPESLAVRTRTFILAQEDINGRHLWSINRRLFDPAFLDASPRLNSVEIWEFTNNSYDTHPMHIHDIEWQILDISGRKPQPGDDGWKDVFVIPALGRLRVIGRFTDLLGTYVFHCHKLEHEDHAMMGQFQVVP